MSERKAREFWFGKFSNPDQTVVYGYEEATKGQDYDELIHVREVLPEQLAHDKFFYELIESNKKYKSLCAELVQALEWYAIQARYEWTSYDGLIGTSLIMDGGDKARKALAKYKTQEEE